jgi:hypothetical protein
MDISVKVNVGFMTPPWSRRPAKLRGVEKGVVMSPIENGLGKARVREYEDAHVAWRSVGCRRPST